MHAALSHPRSLLAAGIYAAVILVAAIHLCKNLNAEFGDGDECGWVLSAVHVGETLAAGDFRPRAWQFSDDRTWGNLNPPFGKGLYAIAAACLRDSEGNFPQPPKSYIFNQSHAWNVEHGRTTEPRLLLAMRRVTVVTGLLLVALSMAIVHIVAGPIAAGAAGLLLAFNPLFTQLSTLVMTDVPYWVFIQLSLLGILWAVSAAGAPSFWRRVRVAALAAGLACCVKLAAVFLLGPAFLLAALVMYLRRGIGSRWSPLRAGLEFAMIVTVVSFLLNPFLWPDLSSVNLAALKQEWRLLRHGEYQLKEGVSAPAWVAAITEQEPGVPGMHTISPEQLARLRKSMVEDLLARYTWETRLHPMNVAPAWYGLTRPLQYPLLFIRWKVFADLLDLRINGGPRTLEGFVQAFFPAGRYVAEGIVALLGVLALSLQSIKVAAPGKAAQSLTLLAFFASTAALVYFTRLVDMERYLFGLYIMRSLLAGIALAFVWDLLVQGRRGSERPF